ncbi:phospholipase D-like domain-containing protein [Alcanivorax sp. S71-1-4]|uniref:phospholipase D-like domain-containing protein n=1 Tax=Alcanivorax sp. S71-1-4 TaxID=1177159 RepID=UPI00135C9DFD|nr:phospholipase D-like domain-containing protein [Alcanivorax sp. S71-1-4]
MPYRLIIEILSRLMKAGWAEAREIKGEVLFSGTESGQEAVKQTDLPRILNPVDRIAKFVLEGYTGGCFRYNDFGQVVSKSRLSHLQESNEILVLESPSHQVYAETADLLEVLLQDEETFKKFGEEQARISDKYCLLNIRSEVIHGLPASASEKLRKLVQSAQKSSTEQRKSPIDVFDKTTVTEISEGINYISARLDLSDALIIGGPAHLNAVRIALEKAEEFVVIHSTFVNPVTFDLLYDNFRNAYERGVRIQILWGQGSPGDRKGSTSAAVRQCEDLLRNKSGGASIVNFEYFSTGSHAKILAYDLPSGHMACVVGSCNWLSSSFDSLECSLRVRDPAIVAPILRYLTELSRPYPGGTSPLTGALVARTLRLKGAPYPHGTKVRMALITGGQHNLVVQAARDHAQENIFVFSHRLGDGARNLICLPLSAAANERKLTIDIYYSKDDRNHESPSAPISSSVKLHSCREPRVHAKCLSWDLSSLLVTSQNLCSADPPDEAHFSELGILVECSPLALEASQQLKGSLLEFD